MSLRQSIPENQFRLTMRAAPFILPLLIGAVAAFPLTYLGGSNFLLGMALFPMAVCVEGQQRLNFLYLVFAILFGALSFLFEVKIFYFYAIAFCILVVLEAVLGRINSLILFLIVVMSPVFAQVAVIVGFPIRIMLSELSGSLLHAVKVPVKVEGNMMVLGGFDFTVDEACMGLNMLAISMLMAVFVLIHNYKHFRRRLPLRWLLAFFLVVFFLNILSNLFRIIVLVFFRILPDNAMHDVVGIICLIVYVMAPSYYISRYLTSRFGTPVIELDRFKRSDVAIQKRIILFMPSIIIMLIGFTIDPERKDSHKIIPLVAMDGLQSNHLGNGIAKLTNGSLLVYVKPIPEFFSGEHTPLICWKGSGFSFKKIERSIIDGKEVYTGTLKKGEELLYTAWWYSNGSRQTIHQIEWRSQMLFNGDKYHVVNVSAGDERTLRNAVANMLERNLPTIKYAGNPSR